MTAPLQRAAVRRLLRAARAHDSQPWYKALLPLSDPSRELPLDNELSPPLASLVTQALRQPPPPGRQARACPLLLAIPPARPFVFYFRPRWQCAGPRVAHAPARALPLAFACPVCRALARRYCRRAPYWS